MAQGLNLRPRGGEEGILFPMTTTPHHFRGAKVKGKYIPRALSETSTPLSVSSQIVPAPPTAQAEPATSSRGVLSWLLPGLLSGGLVVLIAVLGVIWAEIKASESRLEARLSNSEARTEKQLDEIKDDLRALDTKVDSLAVSVERLAAGGWVPRPGSVAAR